MRYSHVLGAAVVGLAAATAVQAQTITVGLQPVASGVAGARTYDLVVSTTSVKWSSADLKGSLITSGNFSSTAFYSDAGGDGNIEIFGAASPLSFDTFVSSPLQASAGTGAVAILGKAEIGGVIGANPTTAIFPTTSAPVTSVDIAWGDQNANAVAGDVANARIARLTVTGNGGGFFSGRVGVTNNTIAPVTFTNLYLPILGDTDGDFAVGLSDLDNVVNNLGGGPVGDTDGDGAVGLADLDNVVNNLGNSVTPPPGAALGAVVPEPMSLSLAGFAGLMLMGRRRSR